MASRKVKLVADLLLEEAIKSSYELIALPYYFKGKKATAFPAMCDKLLDQSEDENRIVVDGNLITSRGPGTSMEFLWQSLRRCLGARKHLSLQR